MSEKTKKPEEEEEELKSLIATIREDLKSAKDDTDAQMQERMEKMEADLLNQIDELKAANAERKAVLDEEEAEKAEKAPGWKSHVEAGTKYDGMKASDLVIAGYMLKEEALRRKTSLEAVASDDFIKALTSTGSGTGDEWVPTGMANELYEEWVKQTLVFQQFPTVNPMPSNPYELPIVTAQPTVYLGATESTATTESTPTSAKITLNAVKLMAETDYSYETEEDSILAIAGLVSSQLNIAMSAAMDSVLINGDTTDSTANISSYTSDPAATNKILALDGLRHFGLVDATGQKSDLTGLAAADYATLMGKLGKYATRPSGCIFFQDVWSYLKALGLDEVRTVDKYGANATFITGELGKVYGIPIVVSEEVAKADTSGYVDGTTAGNNTTGTIILVHKPSWITGVKRGVTVETDRDIQKQQNQVVITSRIAFSIFGTRADQLSAAVGYNVGI